VRLTANADAHTDQDTNAAARLDPNSFTDVGPANGNPNRDRYVHANANADAERHAHLHAYAGSDREDGPRREPAHRAEGGRPHEA